jgi:hypothetical protein
MLSTTLFISLVGLLFPRELDAFSTTALFVWDAPRRVQPATMSRIPSDIRRKASSRSHPSSLVMLSAVSERGGPDKSDNPADGNDPTQPDDSSGIDLALDPRLYRVRLPRTMGIDWKTDLSFRWVSVRGMDPTGAARYGDRQGNGTANGRHCGPRLPWVRCAFASSHKHFCVHSLLLQLVRRDQGGRPAL